MGRSLAPAILAGLLAFGPGSRAATDAPAESTRPRWSFSVAEYGYFVPDDDYVQSGFTADRGRLHLEARHNYEDRHTASVWCGYNFELGQKVVLGITPMLGGVFGRTDGFAPGYHFSIDWSRLSFYTEGEYVFDTETRDDSFFYSWSELTVSPLRWLRAGFVAQRTQIYETERDVQRGLLVGGTVGPVEITGHVFNPDDSDPTWILSVAVGF